MAKKKKSLRNVSELCNDLKRSWRAILGIGIEYNRLANFIHRIIAAHKREMASKDEEIENLKKRISVYEEVVTENGGRFIKQDEEIAKRNSFIKELADALGNYFLCDLTCDGHGKCLAGEDVAECAHIKYRALVKKAREVVK